jgi:hypothetical protein
MIGREKLLIYLLAGFYGRHPQMLFSRPDSDVLLLPAASWEMLKLLSK